MCKAKGITSKKMENKMFCYVYKGRKIVKAANGSIEYKSGQVITLYVNVHISFEQFISLVYGNLSVDPNLVKLHYTCKFDPSMLVLLRDEQELLKMFRFNDMYYCLYVYSKTDVTVDVIAPSSYINLHSL